MASKDPNHINNKEGVAQTRGSNNNKTKSKVGSSSMEKCPQGSHDITYKLLSSQHKRINDVIMSFFLTVPRSHGPSRERRRSHIISTWYLTKKLPQNTSGVPRSQLGSYPPRYTTKDQSKHEQGFPGTHLVTYIIKLLGP